MGTSPESRARVLKAKDDEAQPLTQEVAVSRARMSSSRFAAPRVKRRRRADRAREARAEWTRAPNDVRRENKL